MPSLPDVEAWAIFAKVAELGSFSRAAAEFGLSKATASKAITRLEHRLGAPLLHRTSRRLSLTESGRTALERAGRILAEGEAVEAELGERTAEPRGLVRLTAPVSFGLQALGGVLPDFMARYPQVAVELHLSDRRADLVADGFDLALRIGQLPDSTLRARRLFTVRRPLVAAPAYLARRGTPTHPRELEQHDAIIMVQTATPGVWHFDHPLEGSLSVRVEGRLRLDNGEMAIPALRAGLGIATLPEFLLWPHLRDGGLVEVMPQWAPSALGLHVVTPAGLRPQRVQLLVNFLAERLRLAPWAHGAAASEPLS